MFHVYKYKTHSDNLYKMLYDLAPIADMAKPNSYPVTYTKSC